MKKLINLVLIAEAIVCILLCVLGGASSNIVYDVFSFPFKQIAGVLALLSLSGVAGNVAAWCLYVWFCAIPIIVFVIRIVKRKLKVEDGLLLLLSATLFVVLYYMINNVAFVKLMVLTVETELAEAILGVVAYSVLFGYIIIKAVKGFRRADSSELKSYLNIILFVINIIFVYEIFGVELNRLIINLDNLVVSNTGYEDSLTVTKAFIIGEYVIDVVVNLMIIGIIILVQNLMERLDINKLTDDAVKKAGRISKLCMVAILIHVISYMVYNLLQIACIGELQVVKSVVNLPMILIVVTMIIMISVQFILDAKRIKDENDMFV